MKDSSKIRKRLKNGVRWRETHPGDRGRNRGDDRRYRSGRSRMPRGPRREVPHLGGRVARLFQYFPKLCPPACGLEINFKRIKANPRIKVLTGAEVTSVSGEPGRLQGLASRFSRATSRPTARSAASARRSVPRSARTISTTGSRGRRPPTFPTPWPSRPFTSSIAAPAKRAATRAPRPAPTARSTWTRSPKPGRWRSPRWSPRPAGRPTTPPRSTISGFGQFANVVTNVMMERLASPNGPTGGQDPPALRRGQAQERRFRAVRRLARREPPALLLGRLLRGFAQAGRRTSAQQSRTPRSRSSTSTSGRPGGSRTSTPRLRGPDRRAHQGQGGQSGGGPATQDLLVTAEDVLSARRGTGAREPRGPRDRHRPRRRRGCPRGSRATSSASWPRRGPGSTPPAAPTGRTRSPPRCRTPRGRPSRPSRAW